MITENIKHFESQPNQEYDINWEERWHPLREEWVIIAAHRGSRPWSGQTVGNFSSDVPVYLSDCYLCPGNQRVSGLLNPDYKGVYVFDNDHPCASPDAPTDLIVPPAPYRNRPATGQARVICYNPNHNLTFAELPIAHICEVAAVWQAQTYDLGKRPEVKYVLVFENKGEVVGVSNPHPHGQIYATNFVFKTLETQLAVSRRYWQENEQKQTLFEAIIKAEQQDSRRILFEDDYAIAFVPYFARYPYETYVAPKRSVEHIYDLTTLELESLVQALKSVTVRYDNLWEMSFPYVMTLNQAPTDGEAYPDFHFFIGFLPPLRQPGLLKYLAGPEIGGGNFLSDSSPEAKAAELIAVPDDIHYSQKKRGA